MMSELTRLRDEADRLLTTYIVYKDCNDQVIKRKVHVELDRFLMHNREAAIALMLDGLNKEITRVASEVHLEYEQTPKQPSLIVRLWHHLRRRDAKLYGDVQPNPDKRGDIECVEDEYRRVLHEAFEQITKDLAN